MRIKEGVREARRRSRRSVVTIGAFDGIHMGHRKILSEVVLLAGGLGARGIVVTFEPHPMSVLQPNEAPCLLTTSEERAGLMREAGIDELVVLRFNPKLAGRSAEWFVRNLLLKRLNMRRLVIGYDFRFGRGREGDASYLEALGEKLGFGVDIVPPVNYLDHPVSSTRVRTALVRGDVKSARLMLGRMYSFTGMVIRGEGRGRKLKYPTANLKVVEPRKMVPSSGIYAVSVGLGSRRAAGALYIGRKPTFDGKDWSIEVHVAGLRGSLYGRHMEVFLAERLRDDSRFADAAALSRAIEKDVAKARKIIST